MHDFAKGQPAPSIVHYCIYLYIVCTLLYILVYYCIVVCVCVVVFIVMFVECFSLCNYCGMIGRNKLE